MPVLQQWPVYSTFSQHKMLFLCCCLRNSKTTVTVLSWPVSYQVIALLFAIFYLSWESPFINILLIFLCSPPWCLISYQALLLMGYHNAQEVSCLPGLFITGQFLWRKPENQEIFLNQTGCGLWGGTCFSFLSSWREKRDLGELQQIKPPNDLLFRDSAWSAISVSFGKMKLKRIGQRASQPEEFWRVFLSLLSDSFKLCSRGRIKRAW